MCEPLGLTGQKYQMEFRKKIEKKKGNSSTILSKKFRLKLISTLLLSIITYVLLGS